MAVQYLYINIKLLVISLSGCNGFSRRWPKYVGNNTWGNSLLLYTTTF